jgi:hypothetical protein
MALVDIIKKGASQAVATANAATSANERLERPPQIAKVAKIAEDDAPNRTPDNYRMMSEAIMHVNCFGQSWPSRFLADLPTIDRERLRELERHIDQAVMVKDAESLQLLLDEWRLLLLSHLH